MSANRITIWGNSGSGKSTLAEWLAREIAWPVYHVDRIAWESGWKYRDEATFLELHRRWIEQPRWIVEGVGRLSAIRSRFARADLIIFLNVPVEVCRVRALRRIEADRLTPDPFMAEGCRYADVVDRQWQVIDYFHDHLAAEIQGILESDFKSKRTLTLDGLKTTDELVVEVKSCLGGR